MKVRLLLILLMLGSFAANGIRVDAQSNSSSNGARCEFLVQFKRSATVADRNRVLSTVNGTLMKRIDSPTMRESGRPAIDVVAVPFRARPTSAQINEVVKRIESDRAVNLAEPNGVYSAASSASPN